MVKISEQILRVYPEKLTRAGSYLANLLEANGKPVLTQFSFFRLIRQMYVESPGNKLYLRHETPNQDDYTRLRLSLKKTGMIGTDRDYGPRVIRVLTVPDLPAENIICLVDPTCYVSHLSAMQRWGLTDRSPEALVLTRPDRKTAVVQLQTYTTDALGEDENTPYPSKVIKHPDLVRSRLVHIYETKTAGNFLKNRSDDVRLSTIGQTFLDMLQKPDLCGGMSHILDVWEEHAKIYIDEIVAAVDTTASGLIKSRAGYILEERLELHHPGVGPWKALSQRGGSRKLDPAKEFSPDFSETWMISLNV